jgi:hypothetical protein
VEQVVAGLEVSTVYTGGVKQAAVLINGCISAM